MKKNKGIAPIIILVAVVVVAAASAGTYVAVSGGGDGADTGGYSGTGSETYSGSWSGSNYSGTWQFSIDWSTNDVTGSFSGDASGNISGTVSDGEISAEGEAAFGAISWSGSLSEDGSEISGTWEDVPTEGSTYSGTWSGSLGSSEDSTGEDNETETSEGWEALDISSIDSTIEYTATYDSENFEYTERYRGKDLDTSKPKMRVDYTQLGLTISYIFDADSQTGYVYPGYGENWYSFENSEYTYENQWESYASSLVDYYNDYIKTDDLSWTYSSGGYTYSYEVIDVETNISIDDSVFQPD